MSRPASCHAALSAVGFRLPDGRPLLTSVTLAFGDERTGLVGANGSGKSTLARLLAGELAPSEGTLIRPGTIGFLRQNATPDPGTTVAEALGIAPVLAAVDRLLAGVGDASDVERVGSDWDVRARAVEALAEVGLGHLPLERTLDAVSGGEGTRVALAALLLQRPDLLVLDEPTNHLDVEARAALCQFVARWPRGMIVASHDRALLEGMDRIVELSPLGVRVYGGAYSAYRAQREVEHAAAARSLDEARAALKRARQDVQRTRERKTKRDAHGQRSRAEANQSRLVLNAKREQSQATTARLAADGERVVEAERDRVRAARERVDERAELAFTFPPCGLHARRRVLEARDATFRFEGATEPLVAALDCDITGPERLAVVGKNGSGKSTLLRIMQGALAPQRGTVRRGVPTSRVAVLDQHVRWPLPHASLLDNVLARMPHADAAFARQALASFLFRGDAVLQPVATLSGGEAMRGALATLLHAPEPPWLLLLDEPTNHLDLESVRAVERALARYDGALVAISHDEAFLAAIGVTRQLSREPSGHWRERPFATPFTTPFASHCGGGEVG